MNNSRKKMWWIAAAILLLLAAVGVGSTWRGEYTTEQAAERTFAIEEDFTMVRKIMVRTKAAKEIVTMGGGSEFVEQTWRSGSAVVSGEEFGEALLQNVFSGDPNWELNLSGTLKVRTLDEYIGQHIIALEQDVEIRPDSIHSETHLKRGTERLLGYAMTTRLEREEEHTLVTLQLTQKIKTDAPWFAHGIADRRVLAAVEKTLANQEMAIRQLIAENREKSWLFPLK